MFGISFESGFGEDSFKNIIMSRIYLNGVVTIKNRISNRAESGVELR